jgi:hypothetical protein
MCKNMSSQILQLTVVHTTAERYFTLPLVAGLLSAVHRVLLRTSRHYAAIKPLFVAAVVRMLAMNWLAAVVKLVATLVAMIVIVITFTHLTYGGTAKRMC